MNKTTISELGSCRDREAEIWGWAFNKRSSGSLVFLQIRDGTGFCQAVVDKSVIGAEAWEAAGKVTMESSVKVGGKVVEHPKHRGVFEIHASRIEIVQIAEEYPIAKKEHGVDFLLDHRHLWLRSKRPWAIMRVRDMVIRAMGEWLNDNGFIKIDSPILTATSCEGTTELFAMDYFDLGKAYLSQSGQLYQEAAIFAHGRAYDFGPVFRAEKSKTRRHLTEFWMMDAEAAWVGHEENLKIQEELISYIVQRVLDKNATELAILERDIEPLKAVKPPFHRITHKQAVARVRELGSDMGDDQDLGGDDETALSKEYGKPVFVEKYPAKVKAFYMKRDQENSDLALCADLLAPEGYGEIVGGSVREEDYETLLKRLEEFKLARKDFEWYLDLRRYGSVPHAGFGIGLERLVGWICGIRHIRETIPFSRLINRLTP
ncbi:asparagine--tRNA ligase [Patescibacteria group bacterium]|nr:asparagine--tRNA ligase [Patescibacteria group bacterium]MBU1922060.1 asparagine--tRNA ligase [Patescibacteria group bacterium]